MGLHRIPHQAAWRYVQTLAVSKTVMMLSPSTLEMYREVSLLPTSWTDDKSTGQIPTSGLQTEMALDEWVERLVSEDPIRSLNPFE